MLFLFKLLLIFFLASEELLLLGKGSPEPFCFVGFDPSVTRYSLTGIKDLLLLDLEFITLYYCTRFC